MIWRFLTLVCFIGFTVVITGVLVGAHYGHPIDNPVSTLIVPAVVGFVSFCRVMVWMVEKDDS